jgi:hypothetical protein
MVEKINVEAITPKKAETWLQNNTFERQRSLREHHVLTLAEEMDEGNFIPHSAIVFAKLGNRLILIDGQHRLNALALAGVTIEMPVLIKNAKSMEQVERWYGCIDQGLKRSPRDAIKAQNLHEELEVSERHAARLSAAVKLIASGFQDGGKGHGIRTGGRSNIAISDLMRDWAKESKQYYSLISGGEKSNAHLFDRSAVIAGGLLTLRYNVEKAITFWEGISQDDGLRREDPRKRFLIWLQENKEKISTTARAFSVAWRAYVEGREIKLLRPTEPTTPLRISGVPLEEVMKKVPIDPKRLETWRGLQNESALRAA